MIAGPVMNVCLQLTAGLDVIACLELTTGPDLTASRRLIAGLSPTDGLYAVGELEMRVRLEMSVHQA